MSVGYATDFLLHIKNNNKNVKWDQPYIAYIRIVGFTEHSDV